PRRRSRARYRPAASSGRSRHESRTGSEWRTRGSSGAAQAAPHCHVSVSRPRSAALSRAKGSRVSGDLRTFVEGLLLVLATLLPIVNPFGGAPVFLAMTADCTPPLRATLAQKIAINAFILVLASLFIGAYVLDFFGLSVPVV